MNGKAQKVGIGFSNARRFLRDHTRYALTGITRNPWENVLVFQREIVATTVGQYSKTRRMKEQHRIMQLRRHHDAVMKLGPSAEYSLE
jgi:hypothetical protein